MKDFHTLPRLYTESALTVQAAAVLDTPQTHYLKNVLRRKEGDSLRLFNGRDGEFSATLEKIGKKEAIARINDQIMPRPPAPPRIHLVFAPLKKARMDMLVEKAVELGATDLHPVLTERTENRHLNLERLNAQAIEALEQCERLEKPAIHPPEKLETLLARWQGPPLLACIERAEAPFLADILMPGDRAAHAVLIGPEGGFSPRETDMIMKVQACRPVSLGPVILRAETAVFYVLSLISANFCKNSGSDAKIG